MALLIETTAESGESDVWIPTGPFMLQIATLKGGTATLELLVRASDDAPWVRLGRSKSGAEPLLHCPLHPVGQAKVTFHSNKPGTPVKIWSV